MATDYNQLGINLRVLVEIALTGTTLRYSDTGNDRTTEQPDLNFGSDGRYEARAEIGNLSTAFGSLSDPRQRMSTLNIKLDNLDAALDTHRSKVWQNRTVTIKIGAGQTFSNYTTEFIGQIETPNGVRWSEVVEITIVDRRLGELGLLPTNLFTTTTFANLESGAAGKPIPLLYGDFSATKIPVICINTSADPRQFKICSNALNSISTVYKRNKGGDAGASAWASVATAATDLTAGTTNWNFTVTAANFNPATEEIGVECKGVNLSGSILMENASDIIKDILVTHYSLVDGTDLDTTQFATFKTDTLTFECRHYMNERKRGTEWIVELLAEIGAEMPIRSGKYYPLYFVPSYSTTASLYDRDQDTITDSFSPQDDPERVYANRVDARYDEDMFTGDFLKSYSYTNSGAVTDLGLTIRKDKDFRCLWQAQDVQTAVQRWVMLYGAQIVEYVRVGLRSKAMQLQIGDLIRLTFSRFSQTSMKVLELTKNFRDMTVTAVLLSLSSVSKLGRWTLDTAPNYANASATERLLQGFWCDSSGNASPGDDTSAISHYW